MIRCEVLHQHKGHAGIGILGQRGEECLERIQPAGGSTDPDDGKMGWGMGDLLRDCRLRQATRRLPVIFCLHGVFILAALILPPKILRLKNTPESIQ